MVPLSKSDQDAFLRECTFETVRSGGKGGQHVNKTESKVILVFKVTESAVLNELQKQLILHRLEPRLNNGILRVSADRDRSQFRNKSAAIKRFFIILIQAMKVNKRRIATKIPRSVKAKRKKVKIARQEKKKQRRKPSTTYD